jgi:hypothetical protein
METPKEHPDLFSMGYQLIPLIGKRPAIEWKRLQDSRERIQWDGNVGIVTGKISGCVVIDCDSDGAYGWAMRNGCRSNMVVRTARGFHIYFKYKPMGNRVKVGGRDLDIRGDGGYTVVPPSLHPSGIMYSWEAGPVLPSELPEFPMIEPLQQQRTLTRGQVRNVTAYLSKIRSIQGQNGSAGLIRCCAVCRDGMLSPAQTMAELIAWNQTNAQPPWSVQELAHAVDRVFQKGNA